ISSRQVGPPKPIIRTASYGTARCGTASPGVCALTELSAAQFVDRIDQRYHVIDRSLGQNAVAEIEDVARAPAGLVQNRLRARANLAHVGEQHDRVEISLYRDAVTETRPRLAQVHAPVKPDHVAARLAHQLEQVAGYGSEVNHRHARPDRR